MTITEEAIYLDQVRFDLQFKKRQSEIINEISIWAQSESFRSRTHEVVRSTLNEHDEMVGLAERLCGTQIFTSNVEALAKTVIESSGNKTWIERWSTCFWIIVTAVVTVIITQYGDFLIRKCFSN